MTYSLADGAWLFRRFDTDDDETPFGFSFLRWVTVGNRDDFAAIALAELWETSSRARVSRAFFAARHVGVDLRALGADDIPAHVHLLTTRPDIVEALEIDSDEFERTAWATVEPVEWRAEVARGLHESHADERSRVSGGGPSLATEHVRDLTVSQSPFPSETVSGRSSPGDSDANLHP